MKKLFLVGILAMPFLAPVAEAKPASKKVAKGKVKWRTSFPAALAEAKRTGKPIFVDFYTTWCGPCKYLDDVTYKDPRFVTASKNWVMVKVDAEKNKANVQLARKYKIDGFPSMLFLQSNGKEADRTVGVPPTNVLVLEMKKAAIKAGGGQRI